jgi:hypothetical protein
MSQGDGWGYRELHDAVTYELVTYELGLSSSRYETDDAVAETVLRVVRRELEACSQRLLRRGVGYDAIAVLRLADALAPPAADEQSPDGTS